LTVVVWWPTKVSNLTLDVLIRLPWVKTMSSPSLPLYTSNGMMSLSLVLVSLLLLWCKTEGEGSFWGGLRSEKQTRQCSSSNRERQGNNIRELCKEKKGRWYGLPGTRKEKMTLVIRLSSLPLQLQTCYRGLFKSW
jgi:hypothetical protein